MSKIHNAAVGTRMSVVEKMRAVKSRRESMEESPSKRGSSMRDAKLFHQIYTKERRRVDHSYEPRQHPGKYARKAVSLLRDRHIDPGLWPEYVKDCFEGFARMQTGSAFAPMTFVSSESMIDRFAAMLPARQINMANLKRFLKSVNSHDDPALVASIMRTAIETGDPLPSSMPSLLRRSVMLAIRSFKSDIGYEPLGE